MVMENIPFAPYIAPPLIGAFIGYFTNRVAIRMLFRPLNPWYLGKIKVPMTPGVIPAKRHLLAENIGSMVGNHLLTPDELGKSLADSPFQEHLHTIVDEKVLDFFNRQNGDNERASLQDLVPKHLALHIETVQQAVTEHLAQSIQGYLTAHREQISFAVEERIQYLSHQQINMLLSQGERRSIYALFAQGIAPVLESETTAAYLAQHFQEQIQSYADQGGTLEEILPEAFLTQIQATVEALTPHILARLGEQVEDPAIRAQLTAGMLGGIDAFLESMGPMGAMAKGFVEPEMLEKQLDIYLLENKEKITSWLQEPAIQDKACAALQAQLQVFFQQPVQDFLEEVGEAQVTEICHALASKILGFFSQQESVENFLERIVEHQIDDGTLALADLTQSSTENDQPGFASVVAENCITLLQSNTGTHLIENFVGIALQSFIQQPLGKLLQAIHGTSPAIVVGLRDYLIQAINGVLVKELPGIVDSLRIRELIVDKVDGLDLLALEKMLLSIMEEQFKYINIFGGLLGFLIGCANIFLLAS